MSAEEFPFPAELIVVDVLGPEGADAIVDTTVLEATGDEAVDELAVRRRPVQAHFPGRHRLGIRSDIRNDDTGPRNRDGARGSLAVRTQTCAHLELQGRQNLVAHLP